MARVLIFGASKGIGLETVSSAINSGHRVKAFVRSASSITFDNPELDLDRTIVRPGVLTRNFCAGKY